MRLLQLKMDASAVVEIDMNQDMQSPISVNDGPIESMLNERLGFFSIGTRLYGYVWTGGPNANVTIRYYEARPMGGNRVPICAVARASQANMRKLPGSKPGNAILEFSRTAVWLVDEFR